MPEGGDVVEGTVLKRIDDCTDTKGVGKLRDDGGLDPIYP